jgi:hypothetical protein
MKNGNIIPSAECFASYIMLAATYQSLRGKSENNYSSRRYQGLLTGCGSVIISQSTRTGLGAKLLKVK